MNARFIIALILMTGGLVALAQTTPPAAGIRVKLLWLGTGAAARENNPNILRLHEALDKAGIKNVYSESPGTAHEWLTWRRDLNQFAPLLFQN
jgi:enterochelin esterase-like enzyme